MMRIESNAMVATHDFPSPVDPEKVNCGVVFEQALQASVEEPNNERLRMFDQHFECLMDIEPERIRIAVPPPLLRRPD